MMRTLADEFEEIRPLYAEHLADNDECLPHVLMTDITLLLAEPAVASGELREESFIRRLVDRLEAFWSEEPSDGNTTSNVIAVSFVENFRGLGVLRPFLGPQMGEYADAGLAHQSAMIRRPDGVWVRGESES